MTMDPQQGTTVGQKAQDATGQLADQARQKTGELAQQAQETAKTTLHQQKGQVAGTVDSVAQALRQTGQNLRQSGDQAGLGSLANQAADRLSQFSDDLQNKSVDEIYGDVQDFARRDPQLFLGGAVVLGLLAARFLKASGQRSQSQYDRGQLSSQYGYGRQRSSGQTYRSRPAGQYYSRQDLNDYRDETIGNEYYSGTSNRAGYAGSGANFSTGAGIDDTSAATRDLGIEESELDYQSGTERPGSFPRTTKPGSRSTSGQEGTMNDVPDERG